MLRIGIIGDSRDWSNVVLREIITTDQDSKIKLLKKDYGELEDGTVYYAVPCNPEWSRGVRFDQVIVQDEDIKETEFFKVCIYPYLLGSCVPEEFLVQVYSK